jgi:hypothetical protein
MSAPEGYKHVATLCHASSNVCPEVFINEDADELQQVMITDDFGGKIMISIDQLNILKDTKI